MWYKQIQRTASPIKEDVIDLTTAFLKTSISLDTGIPVARIHFDIRCESNARIA